MAYKRKSPRAFNPENDGEYFSVEFTRDNGERVIGTYKRTGWVRMPADVRAQILADLRHPVVEFSSSPGRPLGPPAEHTRRVEQKQVE